jgi:hypothetical protein
MTPDQDRFVGNVHCSMRLRDGLGREQLAGGKRQRRHGHERIGEPCSLAADASARIRSAFIASPSEASPVVYDPAAAASAVAAASSSAVAAW